MISIRFGPNARARSSRTVFAALGALVLLACGAAPARAEWIRAESPHFIVWSDAGEPRVRDYVQQLETFDLLMRIKHHVGDTPDRKLDVYLVDRHDELKHIFPSIPDTERGFYRASAGDIAAFAMANDPYFQPISGEEKFVENPLFHEYVHHFMLHYFPSAYPRWLVEGYAVYYGATTIKGARVEYGKFSAQRAIEMVNTTWMPATVLIGPGVNKTLGQELQFYAEAGLLTHYFLDAPERRKQLDAYIVAVGRGTPSEKAMQDATGMTMDQLDAVLKTYARGRFAYEAFELKNPKPVEVTVTKLPPSADVLLLDAERARTTGRAETDKTRSDMASYLTTVRAEAARFPGDALADLALARAEIYYGDRKAGEAILDRRLKTDPDNVEALDLAASAMIDDADAETDAARAKALAQQSQPLIGRAFKIDAARYQTLWTFVRSRRYLDQPYPSDNTLEVMEDALGYAPQAADIRLETARALMGREKWRDAATVLGPVANDPHGGGAATEAQALLRDIEKHDPTATSASAPAATSK